MARRPARRLGRPPATDSEETRRRIIETAQRCFGEVGFDKATNNEIADAIGVTSGTIYHYFGSKTDLYVAACQDAMRLITERLTGLLEERQGFVNRLIAMLDAAMDMNREAPALANFLVNAQTEARRHPKLRARVQKSLAALTALFERLVDEGIASGEVAADADPASVVGLIQGLVFGMAYVSTTSPQRVHASVVVHLERLIQGDLLSADEGAAKGRFASAAG